MPPSTLGVDMGGTTVPAALVVDHGRILTSMSVRPTGSTDRPASLPIVLCESRPDGGEETWMFVALWVQDSLPAS